MQVLVPLTSSAHHVELNVNLEADAKYALMGLVKEIRDNYVINPQESNANLKTDYKGLKLFLFLNSFWFVLNSLIHPPCSN